jgi:hypothetical protein
LTPTLTLAGDSSTDKAVALQGQIRAYLRAFQRQLRSKPTTLQLAAMRNAAIAAARYDRALRDYSLSGTSLAHYERVQRKALAQMHASFKRDPQPALTLSDILSSRQEAGDDA